VASSKATPAQQKAKMPAILFDPDEERSKIEFAFLVITKYLEISEAALKKGEEDFAADLQQPKLDIDGIDLKEDDIKSSTAMSMLGKMVFHRHNLVGRMRYGFVIQLYGAFEAQSVALIREIKKRHPEQAVALGKEPDFPEIKEALSALGAAPSILDDIDQLRHLRNCLTHRNGAFDHAKDIQKSVIVALNTADAGIRVDDDGFVEIERRFCEKALSTVTSLFNEMFPKFKFGQTFYSSKPQGYGIRSYPSESGIKYEFMDRGEVAEIQATPEFQEMLKGGIAEPDPNLETDPSPPDIP